ncbi:MAG: hypothetical protein ABI467_17720 [Kofleriaceae bacterium]
MTFVFTGARYHAWEDRSQRRFFASTSSWAVASARGFRDVGVADLDDATADEIATSTVTCRPHRSSSPSS